jgi:hypothetical protein
VRLLAIETSCDETAAAVVDDGRHVLSSIVSSQAALHAPYGGVVPELASRHHVENIVPVVRAALAEAKTEPSGLDAIAVTQGPGLVGALLVGVQVAKGLAFAAFTPTSSDPASPGPRVTASAVRSSQPAPESVSARSMTGTRSKTCCREAISGKTPP